MWRLANRRRDVLHSRACIKPADAARGRGAQREASLREARQETGPRAMVSVLTTSLWWAAAVGAALLAYFLR